MLRIFAAVVATLMVVAMTLVAVLVLVQASLTVAQMPSPLLRASAVVAELLLGVVLLVGTVYLATRLAVRIYDGPRVPRP